MRLLGGIINYKELPDGQNLDSIRATGFYRYANSAGQAITGTGLDLSGESEDSKRNLVIACFGDGSSYCVQFVMLYNSEHLYARMLWGNTGTWSNAKI